VIKIYKLNNQIKHYEWGSQKILPGFLGVENREGRPYAEMWMGTHNAAPSQITIDGTLKKLNEISGELSFLFKLLAVEKPLSIQAHPDKTCAQEGFLRENKKGLSMDDPTRNYKDSNPKNEVLCALTPFTLLAGFRKPEEILASYGAASASQAELIKKMESIYPEDPGVYSPLYLNLLTLQPGEAVFLPAGTVHSYISGFGIELMNNSDNVLRAGLTSKHMDTEELSRIIDPNSFLPEIITPKNQSVFTYPFICDDFSFSFICGKGDKVSFCANNASIGIVTEGELDIDGFLCKKGESFFIPQSNTQLLFSGNFSLYIASGKQQ